MEVCKEMQKLRNWLDQHSIPWEDCSEDFGLPFNDFDSWICRTHFMADNHKVSVINGYGTYGGFSFFQRDNEGLVEVMSDILNDGEPIGHLTAEELIKMLQNQCLMEEISKGVKEDISITLMNDIVKDHSN